MDTQIIPIEAPEAFDTALDWLRDDQLIAFPTDTVYGVGGLVNSSEAIERLYAVKDRDLLKAIPVLLGDMADLPRVSSGMSEITQRLAERFWPGPLTLILPRRPGLPENLSPYPTVGVRMPDHPAALRLLRLAGPMAVSSANLSDQPSSATAEEVFAHLGGRIPLILDGGRTQGGLASTVVDCTSGEPRILRQGPLTLKALQEALGR
jgi:L-threonylcarbamoyladenylate synthase